jgi:glycosyltransferase involved in cell wall biosynthesis
MMASDGKGSFSICTATTVVVRFRDHSRYLPEVLAALAEQTLPIRLIGVDTGSKDGSRALVEAAGATVLELPSERFSYGRAINLGLEAAGSEVAVVLSAHAVLKGPSALECLVAALDDPGVAGAYGRLLPGPHLNPFEARNILSYYDELPRLQRCAAQHPPWPDSRFTNTLSAIRRDVWGKEQFDEDIPGAEDQEWALRVQRRGYAVAYVPTARAFYLQTFGISGIYDRATKVGYAQQMMRPGRLPRLIGHLASAAGWTFADVKSWARREMMPTRWLLVSPLFRLRQELGLYVGAKRAARRQTKICRS